MENNKLIDLNNKELKTVCGGNPLLLAYGTVAALFHVALGSLRSKGYNDGRKSSHCN